MSRNIQMKLTSCLLWPVLALISAAVIPASAEEVQPYAIPGRYIVVLKQDHRPADVIARHGVKAQHVFGHALQGFAAEISDDRLEALRKDPSIELIEPELEVFSSAQTLPTGVKRVGANLSPLAKIDGLDERVNADIAILDTGIAPHPDLNIYTNVSFIAGQTTDGNGHGTHVAGIAAALDNGVVFVVSAGNDSRDVYGPDGLQNTADDSIPAAYPEVMTVSALYDLDGIPSSDDALAGFSNYSRGVVAGSSVTSPGAAIDLAAPGVNIASTYLNSGYATMSGTSMAAPHAAGAAALYIAGHIRATNAAGVYAIRQALINSAQSQG